MSVDLLKTALVEVGDKLLPEWKEDDLTDAVALALHGAGVRRFWTNPERANFLPDSRVTKGAQGIKVYDLAWAITGDTPEVVCNLKLGNGSNPSQEPLLFLADVALGALDRHVSGLPTCALAALRGAPTTVGWKNLAALDGAIRMALDPGFVAAAENAGSKTALCDAQAKLIKPASDSDLSRILTGGTNTRLVGVYKRQGRFDVSLTASVVAAKAATFLLHVVGDVTLDGIEDLSSWWP